MSTGTTDIDGHLQTEKLLKQLELYAMANTHMNVRVNERQSL